MKAITIQLTKKCMLQCPYCFAGNKFDEDISNDVLDDVKDFIKRNNIPLIRITGGEPFLYKKCDEVINYFSKNCVDLKVFSNLCVENCFDNLKYPEKVIVLANINPQDFYTKRQKKTIENNLFHAIQIGIRVILGRTFYKPPYVIDDLVALAMKYGISTLRVSPANPTIYAGNCFMSREQINELILCLMQKQIEMEQNRIGIKIKFDCPIPPCFVDSNAYSYFYKRKQINNKCGNRLVVCTDGSVEHCYVTSSIVKTSIKAFELYDEIKIYLENKLKEYSMNCFDDHSCEKCDFYCSGIPCGCFGIHSNLNKIISNKIKEKCL